MPSDNNPEWFKHCIFHEAAHLTDMVNKRVDLQYKPIGSKLGLVNGKVSVVIDKAEAAKLTSLTQKYISKYSAYDINEFSAEFSAMLLENKIIIEEVVKADGDIENKIRLKEPFINADGKRIEVTPEVVKEIGELVDYYFSIGGQNFASPKIMNYSAKESPTKPAKNNSDIDNVKNIQTNDVKLQNLKQDVSDKLAKKIRIPEDRLQLQERIASVEDENVLNAIIKELDKEFPSKSRLYGLIELSNFDKGGYEAINPHFKEKIQPERFYSRTNYNDRYNEIMEIQDPEARQNALEEFNLMIKGRILFTCTNYDSTEFKYMYEKYVLDQAPESYKKTMQELNAKTGKIIIPEFGHFYIQDAEQKGILALKTNEIDNYASLSETAKDFLVKHKDTMFSSSMQLENGIYFIKDFTQEEIQIFETRNLSEYVKLGTPEEIKSLAQ